MIYGTDISHYQGTFDMHRARAEDFEFVFIKATEGDWFVDSRFATNLANARDAGLLVAAYHYQRANDPAQAQVDLISSVVPTDVPVILDVEAGSGGTALAAEMIGLLHAAGHGSPLLYLPPWYWRQIGIPDLSGFPPLWKSRYPDNNGGYAWEIYQRVPEYFWDGYGGNHVAVLQFTSSATIAGQAPVDADAFLGTREELAALLRSDAQEDDVNARDVWNEPLYLWHGRDPDREKMSAGQQLNQARAYAQLAFDRTVALERMVRRLSDRHGGRASAGNLSEQELRTLVTDAVTEALGADSPQQQAVVDAVTARLTAPDPADADDPADESGAPGSAEPTG